MCRISCQSASTQLKQHMTLLNIRCNPVSPKKLLFFFFKQLSCTQYWKRFHVNDKRRFNMPELNSVKFRHICSRILAARTSDSYMISVIPDVFEILNMIVIQWYEMFLVVLVDRSSIFSFLNVDRLLLTNVSFLIGKKGLVSWECF